MSRRYIVHGSIVRSKDKRLDEEFIFHPDNEAIYINPHNKRFIVLASEDGSFEAMLIPFNREKFVRQKVAGFLEEHSNIIHKIDEWEFTLYFDLDKDRLLKSLEDGEPGVISIGANDAEECWSSGGITLAAIRVEEKPQSEEETYFG